MVASGAGVLEGSSRTRELRAPAVLCSSERAGSVREAAEPSCPNGENFRTGPQWEGCAFFQVPKSFQALG